MLHRVLVALTVLLVAGCAGATPPAAGPAPADVAFVTGMIPHHREAIAMARLVPTRTASPEVRALAGRIEAAQTPEIDRMTGMLAAWAAPRPGETGAMPGMDTAGLAALSGPAFDRAFLTMMTAHHEGAVTMAQAELAQGADAGARELAGGVVATQQAEIAEMGGLLARV